MIKPRRWNDVVNDLKSGNLEKAIDHYIKVLKIDPNHSYAKDCLKIIYAQIEKFLFVTVRGKLLHTA